MLPVVTVEEMQNADREAIGADNALSYSYMQRAAYGIADAVEDLDIDMKSIEIAVLCGKGNNGGDGFVAGRILSERGYRVCCYGIAGGEKLSGSAKTAFGEYVNSANSFYELSDIKDLESLDRYAVLIDALLGMGTVGQPRGIVRDIIEVINSSDAYIISVDTPSGVDCNSSQVGDIVVEADITVSMGYPKIGQLFFPGRYYTGILEIKKLGYPQDIEGGSSVKRFLTDRSDIVSMIPPRDAEGSKYNHGTVGIVAGSRGMTGAASLVANSVLRSGAGMAYLFAPESLVDILSIKLTEPVIISSPELNGAHCESVTNTVHSFSDKIKSLVLGPGVSASSNAIEAIEKLVTEFDIPKVIDGDGLRAFENNLPLFNHCRNIIITPHYGEWRRIFGELSSNPIERVDALLEVAAAYGITILLKGTPTIVATPDDGAFILPVGNSGMATAGSGDVLSGIIGALLAQGATQTEATVASAVIHGKAGDFAADKIGEYSMIASDILDNLQRSFQEFTE